MRYGVLAGILAAAAGLCLAPARASAQGFDDGKVAKAIDNAKKFLLDGQLADGSWSKDKTTCVGVTAMCTYALIECGVKPTEDHVKKALAWLTEQKCNHTYSLGLRCQAYLAAEKRGAKGQYKAFLRKDAEVLIKAGLATGGKYGYTSPGAASDNSNSQYAVRGAWAAGYGFGKPMPGTATPTMTAAGIVSMLVCYEQLTVGSFSDCRGPSQVPAVESGLDWMERYFVEVVGGPAAAKAAALLEKQRKAQEAEETKKFLNELSADERQRFGQEERKREADERRRQRPPGEPRAFGAITGWMFYFLYGVERVGLASGYKYFGTADWYKLGAEHLVKTQSGNGSWGALPDTAFAMIFLVRGRNPVLFNKLAYRGRWKNRPHDLVNLAKWIGDNSEWTVNWQSINPSAPVRDWHDAPILYIAGSTAPYFTPVELGKLRRFVDEGGTILSVTECGGAEFKTGIRQAYQKIFPQYELAPVKGDHEMNAALAMVPVPASVLPPIFAISNGVRPLVVHIDADLPKSWQLRRTRAPESPFEVGANVAQYLAGLVHDLRPRGSSPWPERTSLPMTGRDIRIGRLKYAGNFDAEPLAYDRFSLMMANRQRTPVIVAPPVEIAKLSGAKVHLAVLAGTGKLMLTNQETDALRAFVYDGGTLLVEALGGDAEFARSARAILADVFGAQPVRLEPTHKLYQMARLAISEFHYRRKTQRRLARAPGPVLESISYQDRSAVFFSREDLSTALLGYQGLAVDGYQPETAYLIVRNIALLASGQASTSQPASLPAGVGFDLKGECPNPNKDIGQGKIAFLVADASFGWMTGTCDIDVMTNGYAFTINSGGGNPLCYNGEISGAGTVTFVMGPFHNQFKDAPLRLAGDKPNTCTGKFMVAQGRVQLEKPDGVDAISSDVAVGGQGPNDCLHWINSNQIKDTATITLLVSDKGGAYLSLNGCSEKVTALILTAGATVKTDSPAGQSGALTVKALTVDNVPKPAGAYTAATEKWIEGKGKVVVSP
ncbi:MAG: DUF4159 domain-containing protein [Planctomycetota bacterium]|nr:DUF4159 domain-containing protein [Planctomycetota bacterium]